MPKSEDKHSKTNKNTSQKKKRTLNPLLYPKNYYRKTHSCGITAVSFNRDFIVRAAHATKS